MWSNDLVAIGYTTSTGNHTLRSILQNLSHYKSRKQTDGLPLDLTEGPGATSKNNKTISITTDTCFCHAHLTCTFPKKENPTQLSWSGFEPYHNFWHLYFYGIRIFPFDRIIIPPPLFTDKIHLHYYSITVQYNKISNFLFTGRIVKPHIFISILKGMYIM